MQRHNRIFDWALAAILIGMLACGGSSFRVPMQPLPDTRFILGVDMDSVVVRQVVEVFRQAYPNEAGVCLETAVRDTVLPGVSHPLYLVQVVSSVPAAVARATPFFVAFDTTVFYNGCVSTRQFARAHSHPATFPGFPCSHSDQDAFFLASDPRLLFSMVFCGDGRAEVLWQDGRRHELRWSAPDSSESR